MRLVPVVTMLLGVLAVVFALQGGVSFDFGDVLRRLLPLAALAALVFSLRRSAVTICLFALVVTGALVPPYTQAQQWGALEARALFASIVVVMAGLLILVGRGTTRARRPAPGSFWFAGLFALASWTMAFVVFDAGNAVLGAHFGALGLSAVVAGVATRHSDAGAASLRDAHYSLYLTLLILGALYGGVGLPAAAAAAVLPLGAWALASFVPGGVEHGTQKVGVLDPQRDRARELAGDGELLSPADSVGR